MGTHVDFSAVNNKPSVESGDELPEVGRPNNTTVEMDIEMDLDNNNNTSSSKMGKWALC